MLNTMNKDFIIKVVVVVIALSFLTELFFFGGGINFGNPSVSEGKQVTGLTVFNATIRTYTPYLFISSDTDPALITEIRNIDEVKNIRFDPSGIVIDLETRDDVYPTARYLYKELNITALALANIAPPATIEVDAMTEKVNITTGQVPIQVATEPLLDVDSQVTISMLAVSINNRLVDYNSAKIIFDETLIEIDAIVSSLNYKSFTYSIPWEDRNSLGNLSIYGQVEYDQSNIIIFNPTLSTEQILDKKQLDYIVYIDSSSAEISSDFNDLDSIESNFSDVSFSLPPSNLRIVGTNAPELPYTPSAIAFSYVFKIPDDYIDYEFEDQFLNIVSDNEYQLNDTAQISINAVTSGNRVLSINSIVPPS